MDVDPSREAKELLGCRSEEGDISSASVCVLVYRLESFGVGGASFVSSSRANDVCRDCRKREDAVDERFKLLRVEDAMDGGLGGGVGILEVIEERAAASTSGKNREFKARLASRHFVKVAPARTFFLVLLTLVKVVTGHFGHACSEKSRPSKAEYAHSCRDY